MGTLRLFRDIVRDILTIGTIIAIVFTAIVSAAVKGINDLSGFFIICLIFCYCITGITSGLFRGIEKLNLARWATLSLYIPTSIAGTVWGAFLAQFIINRLFDGAVIWLDGSRDLPRLIIVGLIVSGFVILFDNLNAARKEKQQQLEKEKERAAGLELLNRDATIQMLRSRLNPHFLFNTLNSISELIYQAPEKAEKAVMNLSEIYRRTLAMSEEETVSVAEELELMEAYLENERMRFGSRLAYRLDVDPDCESVKIPALILQPFVENAITRGIAPKKEGGTVSISVRPEEGGLLFSIEDTGAGCETFRPGFGIQNVLRRMDLLYQEQYRFNFESDMGRGAKVSLYIPGKR
jgi:two-component system, LytTR family, sensor kinase